MAKRCRTCKHWEPPYADASDPLAYGACSHPERDELVLAIHAPDYRGDYGCCLHERKHEEHSE